RAPSQQVRVASLFADLLEARAGRLLTHLITDRITEVPGDGQLMRRAPRRCRGDLDRAVVLVTDPTALDGDRAEARLEREGTRPPAPGPPCRACRHDPPRPTPDRPSRSAPGRVVAGPPARRYGRPPRWCRGGPRLGGAWTV